MVARLPKGWAEAKSPSVPERLTDPNLGRLHPDPGTGPSRLHKDLPRSFPS